ncbi:MAG: SPFH domain-containing protein [Erysipelotrichaceae bacterium]|nr:SPFH domain-containing protein [Erysipelotrichaceae bacterium]
MGLIKAVLKSASSVISDTWKDYFVCDSLDNDTLMTRGVKKGGSKSDEVITNGSGIVVQDGQCALIVDEGQILEVAAEPGSYTFDTTKSPSVFDGGFAGIRNSFAEMVERFTFNGETAKNQRVYYVNTKEIHGNLFGTATPIPFRIVDPSIGLDLTSSIRCNGEYTFRIVNPLLFYKNVASNVSSRYDKAELSSTMKAELLTALQPALAKISAMGVRYSEVPAHTFDLVDSINETLERKWGELRGMQVVSLNLNSLSLSKEDESYIKELQLAAVNRNQDMREATLAAARAQSLKDAAKNPNGAANAFFGINMAENAGGGYAAAAASNRPANTNSWTCSCGETSTGNFCPKCGQPKPVSSYCPQCGKPTSGGNFCPHCGSKLG